VLRAEEAPAEGSDRSAGQTCPLGDLRAIRVHDVGHGAQCAGRVALRVGTSSRRQSSMTAEIPAPAARAQPSRRSGMAEFGAVIVTGKMKVRSAPVEAAAK
jgi:hypothetical protein